VETRTDDNEDRSRAWVAPKLTVLGALDSHTEAQTILPADATGSGVLAGDSGFTS
jgi:hypothetical protein